jgi:purine-binding chemotaxis protein CheW
MTKAGEQLVTFHLNEELFGIEMEHVREIIRLPEMVRVPGAPAHFSGLANLRGEILSVLDGRKLLGMPEAKKSDTVRVLVLEHRGETAGCLVDRLSEVVDLEGFIEDELKTAREREKLLSRVVKKKDGTAMIMVVDIEAIFPSLEETTGVSSASVQELAHEEKETLSGSGGTKQFMGFKLGAEEYALPVEEVQEIVRVPAQISCAPGLPHYIDGLFSLRRQTVPLLNLRRYFNVDHDSYGERAKVVVLNLSKGEKKSVLGFGVDAITEVLRLAEEDVEPLPELFRGEIRKNLKGVCKLGEGERIIYLLDSRSIGEEDELGLESAGEEGEKMSGGKGLSGEELYVVFFLQEEEFAVSINSVREIIRLPEIVRVPQAPPYVEGVVNIRGEILPVVNLRRKLNLPAEEKNERNRIVVVDLNGVSTGLIVDSVREVRKIAADQIAPVPGVLQSCLEADYLQGVVKFAGTERIILLLKLQELLESAERMELAQMSCDVREVKADEKEDEGADR